MPDCQGQDCNDENDEKHLVLRVKDYGLILVPTCTARAAHAALRVGRARNFLRVTCNARHCNAETVSRALWQWSIYHVSGETHVQVVG